MNSLKIELKNQLHSKNNIVSRFDLTHIMKIGVPINQFSVPATILERETAFCENSEIQLKTAKRKVYMSGKL